MLENNSTRLIFAAIAVVIGGVIYGTVNAAYPEATNQLVKKIQAPFTDSNNSSNNNASTVPELDSVSKEAHVSVLTGNSYDSTPSLDKVINSMPDTDTLTVNGHKLTVSSLNRGGSNYYTINNITGDSKIIEDAKSMMDSGFNVDSSSYGSDIQMYQNGKWYSSNMYSSGIKSQLWTQALRDVQNENASYDPDDVSFNLGFLVNVTAVDGTPLPQQDADGNNISHFYEIPIKVTLRFK